MGFERVGGETRFLQTKQTKDNPMTSPTKWSLLLLSLMGNVAIQLLRFHSVKHVELYLLFDLLTACFVFLAIVSPKREKLRHVITAVSVLQSITPNIALSVMWGVSLWAWKFDSWLYGYTIVFLFMLSTNLLTIVCMYSQDTKQWMERIGRRPASAL